MSDAKTYYVYALKDTRSNPAKPFYIGKGTGIRAWEHAQKADDTRKGDRIREILTAGATVLTTKLVEGLSEIDALRIEAELIASFGTESSGGSLTNTVSPNVSPKNRKLRNLNVPIGVHEKAQIALQMLKDSVLELAIANEAGVTNSDVAHTLGLQSDYLGGSKDYLSWSILGLLMREGKLTRVAAKRHKAQVK
ncbi:MAG TPA: GIY-YIG nuclease family protein [Granulicella sp.]